MRCPVGTWSSRTRRRNGRATSTATDSAASCGDPCSGCWCCCWSSNRWRRRAAAPRAGRPARLPGLRLTSPPEPMHPHLLQAMRRQPQFDALVHGLPIPGVALRAANLHGSSATLLIAALAEAQPQRLWVIVANTPPQAEAVEADLHAYLDEA